MKHLYIRGFIDGNIPEDIEGTAVIQYRFYDNSHNFKENWDEGIGTYTGLNGCDKAISQFSEPVKLMGFDIHRISEEGVKNCRSHLEQSIREHNSAIQSSV